MQSHIHRTTQISTIKAENIIFKKHLLNTSIPLFWLDNDIVSVKHNCGEEGNSHLQFRKK